MFQKIRQLIINLINLWLISHNLQQISTLAGIPVKVDKTNAQYRSLERVLNVSLGGGFYSPFACYDSLGRSMIMLPHNWWCYLSESQMAGVLQHELGHLSHGHRTSRRQSLWRDMANEDQADLFAVQSGHGEDLLSALTALIDHMERHPHANHMSAYQINMARKRIRKIRIAMNLT